MRAVSERESALLTTYEFAVLCCVNLAGDGASAKEISEYLWGVCGILVGASSLSQVLGRMEQMAYVGSPAEKRKAIDKRRGPGAVKIYYILNPGRDALHSHHKWLQRVWQLTVADTNCSDLNAAKQ